MWSLPSTHPSLPWPCLDRPRPTYSRAGTTAGLSGLLCSETMQPNAVRYRSRSASSRPEVAESLAESLSESLAESLAREACRAHRYSTASLRGGWSRQRPAACGSTGPGQRPRSLSVRGETEHVNRCRTCGGLNIHWEPTAMRSGQQTMPMICPARTRHMFD